MAYIQEREDVIYHRAEKAKVSGPIRSKKWQSQDDRTDIFLTFDFCMLAFPIVNLGYCDGLNGLNNKHLLLTVL
jgi:hypothetical protein